MTKPTIKVNSAPDISAQEFEQKAQGSKYVRDPGTYTFKVMAAEWGQASRTDPAWHSVKLVLQDASGKEFTNFLEIPVECKNNFLHGEKMSPYPFKRFKQFMAGFGVEIVFESAMKQIGELFADLEQFIGKEIRLRLGFTGTHLAYLGKSEAGQNQYAFVDKEGNRLDDVVFPDYKAAELHAQSVNLKYKRFMDVLEVVPGTENQFETAPTLSAVADIPF